MLTLDFRPQSPNYIHSISSRAGIIPDRPNKTVHTQQPEERCGIFADAMPQTILTHVVNYRLTHIMLCGNESQVMIDNLRRTLIPDFVKEITIIKDNKVV